MIRFINMGNQVYDNLITSFAFLDTSTDHFLEFNGSVYWDSYNEFCDDFQASLAHGGTARREVGFWTRISGLIPAHIKPKKEVIVKSFVSGQPLSFTIYFANGFSVTINSIESVTKTDPFEAETFEVSVASVGYRNLKLDAKLPDNKPIILTIEELIICLGKVVTFQHHVDLFACERSLRIMLNKTL